MARVRKKGKKTYRIDATGVEKERRKRGKRIPEGDYLAKIVKHDRRKKEGGDSYYFNWQFQIIEDSQGRTKHAGLPFYYITSLKPEALFNLRNLILAATGKNIAGKTINFDPTSLYGKKIGITVEDEEFEGKVRSKAVDVIPEDEVGAEEEDEDEDEDEDEEDEDEEDEDEDSDDDDESDDDEDEDEDDLDDVDLEEDL